MSATGENNLGGSVGLDVTDFEKGVSKLKNQVKNIGASFRASATVMEDWGNTSNGLKERISSLKEEISKQKQEMEIYRQELTKVSSGSEKDQKAADSLTNKMYYLQKQIGRNEKDLGKYNTQLNNLQSPTAGLSENLSALSQNIELSKSKFNAAVAGMKNWSKNTDGLKAKITSLGEEETAHKEKLSALESAYSKVAEQEGKNSTAAKDLAIRLTMKRLLLQMQSPN